MLLVIFGAGASYDSAPSYHPKSLTASSYNDDRPPLANELFGNRPHFAEGMARFPKCQPVIPLLRHRDKDVSVEQVLEQLQTEAENYAEGYRQLAAIRYYLHFMIWECEHRWGRIHTGVTNYKTLLDRIHRRRLLEQVCLVTFNYDRMLEEALPTVGIKILNLSDYITSDDYKIIKLHGSVNWARELYAPIPIENIGQKNVWEIAYELIERAADLDISDKYRMVYEYPIAKFGSAVLFPAVAIPVETKRDFECPEEHLNTLREFIPKVTKLLLIGWRATDAPFLELLSGSLPPRFSAMVVAGGREQAEEVVERMRQAGIKGEFLRAEGGLTDFILDGKVDEFLR